MFNHFTFSILLQVKENSYLSQLEEYKNEVTSLKQKLTKLDSDNETLKRDLHDRDVNKVKLHLLW